MTQRSNSDRDFGHIVVWSVDGPVHTAEIKGTGAKMIARGNDAWTIYWHDRVVVSRPSGAVLSLGQPDGSFDFYKLPDRQVVEPILVSLAENGDALTTMLNGLGFIFGIWDGSTTGQRFARVAEMNRLIADVPSPCNAKGWASVVRVLAADDDEWAWTIQMSGKYIRAPEHRAMFVSFMGPIEMAWRLSEGEARARCIGALETGEPVMLSSDLTKKVNEARASIVFYATQRFVHDYDVKTATRLTLKANGADRCPWTERLLRTYEANR